MFENMAKNDLNVSTKKQLVMTQPRVELQTHQQ